MTGYIFPGQGSQFPGMGNELYEEQTIARELFEQANDVLGFRISDVMFTGSAEDLKQTKVTQPAIFLHSVITTRVMGTEFQPDSVAGHSLGEFSALVASGSLTFETGLRLVYARAIAMQHACEQNPGTMAAIIGLDDEKVEEICADVEGILVPANYNCPGQLVISGDLKAVEKAIEMCSAAGARKAIQLQVGGAFHSALMEPAREELENALGDTHFERPICAIYQNFDALPVTEPVKIKANLIAQLTAPVLWTQIMGRMLSNGILKFVEVGGKGRVLAGLVRRYDRSIPVESV